MKSRVVRENEEPQAVLSPGNNAGITVKNTFSGELDVFFFESGSVTVILGDL